MLFIDKCNKIAPNIYIIDIGGYFNNVFEGLFGSYRPYLVNKFNNYRKYNNYKYWQVRH